MSKGLEAQKNYAAEIKIRAQRKAGQILKKMLEDGERNGQGGSKLQAATLTTLADLGIEKTDCYHTSRARKAHKSRRTPVLCSPEAHKTK